MRAGGLDGAKVIALGRRLKAAASLELAIARVRRADDDDEADRARIRRLPVAAAPYSAEASEA